MNTLQRDNLIYQILGEKMISDEQDYMKLTAPQNIEKAIHTFEGLIKGIGIDNVVNEQEINALRHWMDDHQKYAKTHPFNELIPLLEEVLEDEIFNEEEKLDLLWLCEQMTIENLYNNDITSDIQRLQGILAGIIADGIISKEELDGLSEWLKEHDHLKTCWPFDEIDSLVISVLEDGVIDNVEHKMLLEFFNEFINYQEQSSIDSGTAKEIKLIKGVCSNDPDIEFQGRVFCFTGKLNKATRKDLAEIIKKNEGIFTKKMSENVDYLIVASNSNPAWAYACYGRKVEQAITMRKEGKKIAIVHEKDFWNGIEAQSK